MNVKSLAAALVLAAAVALPAHAQPSEARLEAARDLVQAAKMREQFDKSLEIGMQQGANGQLTAAQLDAVREVMREHFSYEDLEAMAVEAYADLLTVEQMRAAAAFYRTPEGEGLLEATPELMGRVQAFTMARMQTIIPILMQRMMALEAGQGAKPPAHP